MVNYTRNECILLGVPIKLPEDHPGVPEGYTVTPKTPLETSGEDAPTENPPHVKAAAPLPLVQELMLMGFGQVLAEKALYLTRGEGVEKAANWIADHSEDPDVELHSKRVEKISTHTPNERKRCESTLGTSVISAQQTPAPIHHPRAPQSVQGGGRTKGP
jgi:hypothetical protein